MAVQQESRFLNYSRNMVFALLTQFVTIALNLIGRRVFVQQLDIEYLGLSGLFTNVLSLLSLAELGIGHAIIYSMYKPIAIGDNEKIKSLMKLYRRVYVTVGILMLVLGAIIAPWIENFIKEVPDIDGLHLIFMLFVVQTASTYFFSYKTNFLLAMQKNYILQIFNIISSVAMLTLQIISLILFKNYYIYLLISIICPLIKNMVATIYVNRRYPFLKEKAQNLEKQEVTKISKNVFALFLYKISSTLSATIDTILVSKFLGIVEVAIYYNYHYILAFSDTLFTTVLGTITPSLGNFMAVSDTEKKKKLFSTMQMIYYWIGTYLAVGLILLFNPLIEIWLGKEFLFPQYIVVALAVSATLTNFQRPCALLRDSNGLFWYGKLRPLAMSVINIISSIIFVKLFGTVGVVLGTILAKASTYVWYDPYIAYKYVLKGGLSKYFVKYAFQWLFLAFNTIVCYAALSVVHVGGIAGFLIGALIITVIVNGNFILLNYKKEEFEYIKTMTGGLIKKVTKKGA